MAPKRIVVDSSVIVKWLSNDREEYLEEADKLLKAACEDMVVIMAPELARYEVSNALMHKGMDVNQLMVSVSTIFELPIRFMSQSSESAQLSAKIASENGMTFYDATFVALAIDEKAVLVTENVKHQAKCKDVKVLSLKDW